MESRVEIPEKYLLDLLSEMSRDIVELHYPQTNKEAMEAAARRPRLREARVRILQPDIIMSPTLLPLSAEFFGQTLGVKEKVEDEIPESDMQPTESRCWSSGVATVDKVGTGIQTIPQLRRKKASWNLKLQFHAAMEKAEDETPESDMQSNEDTRRDSGVAIDDKDEHNVEAETRVIGRLRGEKANMGLKSHLTTRSEIKPRRPAPDGLYRPRETQHVPFNGDTYGQRHKSPTGAWI